jgi:hypothetical protein
MSEVSCTTTLSMESVGTEECKDEDRLEDLTEENENVVCWRSDFEKR